MVISAPFPRARRQAFTLVEIMVTVAIISVLALISVGAYTKYLAYADNAACIMRMKDVGAGLANYTLSRGEWPQCPESLETVEEEKVWEWWINKLEPYGGAPVAWLCPADERMRKQAFKRDGTPREKYEGTYIPTYFDTGADTPFKWTTPWLVERGAYHPNGQNILLSNRSIVPFKNPVSRPQRPKK